MIAIALLSLALASCASIKPAKQLLGQWDGQLHGYPVLVEYTATTVAIGKMAPVTYSLDGDLITLAGDSPSSYRLAFPSKNEMIQVDNVSGSEIKYTRRLAGN